jgi:hypothetical protein
MVPSFSVNHRLLNGLPDAIILVSQNINFFYDNTLSPNPQTRGPVHRTCIYKPRGRVAHFSRLLRHAWVTLGLFLFPATTRECKEGYNCKRLLEYVFVNYLKQKKQEL